MPGFRYVGRSPASAGDSSLVPKSYADTAIPALEPGTAWVTNQLNQAIATANLVTSLYVDQKNATLAQIAAVNAADATYAAASSLNQASGAAGLDGAGNLRTAELPTGVPTEFTAKAFDLATYGSVLLSGTATVATDNLRELQLAQITCPDPGYPWRPIPLGIVGGGNPNDGTAPDTRTQGTGNYGMVSVIPPLGVSDQVYGVGYCSDSYYLNYYPFGPYAAASQTPTTVPAVQGGLELLLCGCCWTGTGYEFTNQGLEYWILALPAM